MNHSTHAPTDHTSQRTLAGALLTALLGPFLVLAVAEPLAAAGVGALALAARPVGRTVRRRLDASTVRPASEAPERAGRVKG